MRGLTIAGRATTGSGEGARFTGLEWARRQFIAKLGINPFPGTLNLIVESPNDLDTWSHLRNSPGIKIVPPNKEWCTAQCYPVRVQDRIPGAIVYPLVPGYSGSQLEVIAALSLRESLSVKDGELLTLTINRALKVKGVIFDVDGTLVDSLEAYRVVAERAAMDLDISITDEMIRHALNNAQNFWNMVLPKEQPNREHTIEQLKSKAISLWPEVLRTHGQTVPDLRETLDSLRAQGAKLGIFTGSKAGSFQPLERQGLMELFEAILTGASVKKRKPSPDGLLKCARMLEIHPNQCVYVGDTSIDVEASKAAGMASVAVLTGAGNSALLSASGPDWIIYSASRLPSVLEIMP